MNRAVQMREFEDCLRRCLKEDTAARDRLIFDLYFVQGYSAKEIASTPGIVLGVEGVESAICRMCRIIREELGIVPEKPKTKAKDSKKSKAKDWLRFCWPMPAKRSMRPARHSPLWPLWPMPKHPRLPSFIDASVLSIYQANRDG